MVTEKQPKQTAEVEPREEFFLFLEVEVREVTVTENGKEKKFNAYKAYESNGRKVDLKFRKEADNIPKENCFIKVSADDMNKNTNKKYPEIWVKNVKEIIPLTARRHTEEEYKELGDMFSSKLPF